MMSSVRYEPVSLVASRISTAFFLALTPPTAVRRRLHGLLLPTLPNFPTTSSWPSICRRVNLENVDLSLARGGWCAAPRRGSPLNCESLRRSARRFCEVTRQACSHFQS